jgi:putative SOS response-associated peptidase YedK
MCYNIAFLTKRLEKYAERYKEALPPALFEKASHMTNTPDFQPWYFVSGFEHPALPLVSRAGILFARWGLIPQWTRSGPEAAEIRSKTLNAVGETIFEKPSFRNNILTRRCILGVDGFFEWRTFNNRKYPYYITSTTGDLLSLGCIYDQWTDRQTGEVVNTFSIVTTPANPMMETIHNTKKRMPLILLKEHEKLWVSPTLQPADVANLIRPLHNDALRAHTISMNANNSRNDRNYPEITEPVAYPALGLFG